jgi:hypothetical protein
MTFQDAGTTFVRKLRFGHFAPIQPPTSRNTTATTTCESFTFVFLFKPSR